jgi:hypothetical protein
MKKIIFLILTLVLVNQYIFGQTSSTHKLQMGIVLSSGLNFSKMNTRLASGNVGTDLTIGMNVVKNINDNLGFITGIEFDFSRMNYKLQDSLYYQYVDAKIETKQGLTTNSSRFQVTDRTQTPIYLSVPTMFVFRTDYFGYNRYFAKFGMRHSFALKSQTDDKGFDKNSTTSTTLTNMDLPSDLSIYKGSFGIAGGMEWNYYGSSTMVFELGYYYGINNIHRGNALVGDKEKNMSLMQGSKSTYTTLSNTQNQLTLKVSFLF